MYEFMLVLSGIVIAIASFVVFFFWFESREKRKIEESYKKSENLRSGIVSDEEIGEALKEKKAWREMVKKAFMDKKNGRQETKDVPVRTKLLDALELSGEESEKALQKEILERLRNSPEKIKKEDGSEIVVVPLESLAFMNRFLNPLVNEHGEIVVKMKEDPVIEDIKKIIISLKEDNEILYKSDEELIQAVKEVILIARKLKVPVTEAVETFKRKIESKSEEKTDGSGEYTDKQEKQNSQMNEREPQKREDKKIDEKQDETLKKKNEEKREKKSEPKEKVRQELHEVSPDDIEEESLADLVESHKNGEISLEDLEDLDKNFGEESFEAMSLGDVIDKETVKDAVCKNEEKNEEHDSVYEMLAEKPWKEGKSLTPFVYKSQEIAKHIQKTIEENERAFASNVVKHAPIIFNDSKTEAFIDIKILISAVARLYGPDFQDILKKMKKLPVPVFNAVKKGFAQGLERYLAKKDVTTWTFKKNGTCFRGTGIWIEKDFFKMGFDRDEDFDFYRSFAPDEGFRPTPTKEEGCSLPLIQDYASAEIKKERSE